MGQSVGNPAVAIEQRMGIQISWGAFHQLRVIYSRYDQGVRNPHWPWDRRGLIALCAFDITIFKFEISSRTAQKVAAFLMNILWYSGFSGSTMNTSDCDHESITKYPDDCSSTLEFLSFSHDIVSKNAKNSFGDILDAKRDNWQSLQKIDYKSHLKKKSSIALLNDLSVHLTPFNPFNCMSSVLMWPLSVLVWDDNVLRSLILILKEITIFLLTKQR
jgi:hypothetical protein